jgi:hypothetical protein
VQSVVKDCTDLVHFLCREVGNHRIISLYSAIQRFRWREEMVLANDWPRYMKRQEQSLSNLLGATSPPDREMLRLIALRKSNIAFARRLIAQAENYAEFGGQS